MAEPAAAVMLRLKRDEIVRAIAVYEDKLTAARESLLHVEGALRLFTPEGRRAHKVAFGLTTHLFQRGELLRLLLNGLASEGPSTSAKLALFVIRAKGMDETDIMLRRAVAYRTGQAMRVHVRNGKTKKLYRSHGRKVYGLVTPPAANNLSTAVTQDDEALHQ